MGRRLVQVYAGLQKRPYKLGLRFRESPDLAEVIEIRRYYSYGDFVSGILKVLSRDDPEFMGKVCAHDDNAFMNSHKTRRYVAKHRDHLYINAPHLTSKYSRKLGEYWIATNIGQLESLTVARAAAEAKGVKCSAWSQLTV